MGVLFVGFTEFVQVLDICYSDSYQWMDICWSFHDLRWAGIGYDQENVNFEQHCARFENKFVVF